MTGTSLSGAIWDCVGYFIEAADDFLHRWGFDVEGCL